MKEIDKIIKKLEHSDSIDKVIDIISNLDNDVLRALLVECNHGYVIHGCTRGYLESVIWLSSRHFIELHTGTGLITCKDIGKKPESDYIDEDLRKTIDKIMEDIFFSEEDVD